MTRIGVLQSFFIPWLGVFNQIASVDLFILGDSFKYSKNSWINRNRVRDPRGAFLWLTVPVRNQGLMKKTISEVEIDYTHKWTEKHLATIRSVYGKSPYFREYYPQIEKILLSKPRFLHDLNTAFLLYFLELLDIKTQIKMRSSYSNLPIDKNHSLLQICKNENANVYFSGPSGQNYLDNSLFSKNGVLISYQKYSHKQYLQMGSGYVEKLSILDSLFMLGHIKTRELIYVQK